MLKPWESYLTSLHLIFLIGTRLLTAQRIIVRINEMMHIKAFDLVLGHMINSKQIVDNKSFSHRLTC